MIASVVLVCLALQAVSAYRFNDIVRTQWREDRAAPWMTQPSDACPRFGVDLKITGSSSFFSRFFASLFIGDWQFRGPWNPPRKRSWSLPLVSAAFSDRGGKKDLISLFG